MYVSLEHSTALLYVLRVNIPSSAIAIGQGTPDPYTTCRNRVHLLSVEPFPCIFSTHASPCTTKKQPASRVCRLSIFHCAAILPIGFLADSVHAKFLCWPCAHHRGVSYGPREKGRDEAAHAKSNPSHPSCRCMLSCPLESHVEAIESTVGPPTSPIALRLRRQSWGSGTRTCCRCSSPGLSSS